jgi:hypothetical protein
MSNRCLELYSRAPVRIQIYIGYCIRSKAEAKLTSWSGDSSGRFRFPRPATFEKLAVFSYTEGLEHVLQVVNGACRR